MGIHEYIRDVLDDDGKLFDVFAQCIRFPNLYRAVGGNEGQSCPKTAMEDGRPVKRYPLSAAFQAALADPNCPFCFANSSKSGGNTKR